MRGELISTEYINNKKHFTEITLLRGLATLIILAIHTIYILTPNFRFFYTCAVPIFFFLSGLTLTLNYKDNLDLYAFYKKRFQYLIPAYLFWTFLLVFYSFFSKNLPIQIYIIRYIITILTGDIMTLYFLIAIFEFYLIFPFILRFMKKNKARTNWFIFLSLILLYFTIYLFSINFYMIFLKSRIIIFQFEIYSNFLEFSISKLYFLIFMIPFCLLGIIFCLNYDTIREYLKSSNFIYYISIMYVFLAVFFYIYKIPYRDDILDYNNYLNFVSLSFTLISILFFLTFFIRYDNSFLYFIGILSTGIFLSHRVVMMIFLYFFNFLFGFKIEDFLFGFPFYIIVILSSIILVLFIKKFPKSEYIILI